MHEDLKDLSKATSAMHAGLDDSQVDLIINFLTEYSVCLTDRGVPSAAKFISGISDMIYNTRKWK